MPSVIYAQCHIVYCYAVCCYTECRYAECFCPDCPGAINNINAKAPGVNVVQLFTAVIYNFV
jgi:hypothetical protein